MERDRGVPAGAPAVRRGGRRMSSARIAGVAEVCAFARGRDDLRPGRGAASSVWIVRSGSRRGRRPRPRAGPARPGRAVRALVDARPGCRPASRARPRRDAVAIASRRRHPPAAGPARGRCATSAPPGAADTGGPAPAASPRPSGRSAALLRAPARALRARHADRDGGARHDRGTGRRASRGAARGSLGILTDRDLRWRVLAAGPARPTRRLAGHERARVHRHRRPPVRRGALEMLDRGVHHFPVLSPAGRVLGWSTTATWSPPSAASRSCCARDHRRGERRGARAVARGLRPAIIALHDARVAAERHRGDHSVVAGRASGGWSSWPSRTRGSRRCRSPGSRWEHRPPGGGPELRRRLRDRLGRRRPRPGDPRLHAPRRGARPRRPRRVRPAVRPEGRDRVAPPLRPLARRLGRARSTRGSTSRPRRRR